MAKLFLDINIYFDILYQKPEVLREMVPAKLFFSPLSTHILFYTFNIKVPSPMILEITKDFQPVNLTSRILVKAMSGPTNDLEDNIQLHSAAEAECDYFFTNDKNLLKMKFFGKTRIISSFNKTLL